MSDKFEFNVEPPKEYIEKELNGGKLKARLETNKKGDLILAIQNPTYSNSYYAILNISADSGRLFKHGWASLIGLPSDDEHRILSN